MSGEEPASSQASADEFTHAEVVRLIRGRNLEFSACYDESLRTHPETRGRLVVRFTIKPDGTVGSAGATEPTAVPSLDECVLAIIRRFRWNRGPAAEVRVTYPFVFAPADAPPASPVWTEVVVDNLVFAMPAPPQATDPGNYTCDYQSASFRFMRTGVGPNLRALSIDRLYDSMAQTLRGVVAQHPVALAGHVGRAIEIDSPLDSNLRVEVRVFAIGGTLYQLIASTWKNAPMPDVTRRFFDSLRERGP